MKIRYHEGIFYPREGKKLESLISPVEAREERPRALILPHSGLERASSLLKAGFSFIKNKDYETIIILSPIHSGRRDIDSLFSFFEGEENKEEGIITLGCEKREYYDQEEPAGEILLPYIKRYSPHSRTAVIYTDIRKARESRELSSFLSKWKNEKTLFIISTNLSAVSSKIEERKADGARALEALQREENILDLTNKNKVHICASGAIDSINRLIKGEWKKVESDDYGGVIHAVLWK